MKGVPSATVGVKISEWYDAVNQFDVKTALKLKRQVEDLLEQMEEDQNVLIYYQLMKFRHDLAMNYLFPSEASKPLEKWEYLKKSEGKGQKLTRLMEYYANFFDGMNHFAEGNYIAAIKSYRQAEKKLNRVVDKIEKAEFFYKMAEVYYHMKQTQVSLYYVNLAYDIYKKQDTYIVRSIQCLTVIAGNYIDLLAYEKALPYLKKALLNAEEFNNKPMITKGLLNVGCCYNAMDEKTVAIAYFRRAIKVGKETDAKELTQAYYELALLHFKQDEKIEGQEFYEKALESAHHYKDELFLYLLKFLKVLFIESANRSDVLESLNNLKNSRGYPYLEELALVAAEFYTRKERMADSVFFYEEMVLAQKQIQRGDFLYET
ncbi:response regulator aspartate phosphatase [Bacillus velezensis]|uniref:response regulator aspartate phosphatase n=1 Tax=Bacillus velezensis TaxID=492670 RepID=UPI0007D09319|nr:tetratricopeptide repeat protein [Bacillus velezensis]OAL91157.1 aspartate phosphatase [Bacillus velezensis]